ncbi:MAG: hypothetical protein ACRDNH_01215 [Gaiellaceae bacterium]
MSGETREDLEAEIAAIVSRLREEVGRASSGSMSRSEGGRPAARAQAERAWAVSAERPLERRPNRRGGIQNFLIAPVKRLLRKLMRWYVEPLAAQQRTFNLTILNLIDELAERVESLEQQRRQDRNSETDG